MNFAAGFSELNSLIKLTDHRAENTLKVTRLPKSANRCDSARKARSPGFMLVLLISGSFVNLEGFTSAEADVLPLNYSRHLNQELAGLHTPCVPKPAPLVVEHLHYSQPEHQNSGPNFGATKRVLRGSSRRRPARRQPTQWER